MSAKDLLRLRFKTAGALEAEVPGHSPGEDQRLAREETDVEIGGDA
jgi:hypothetical protein